MLFDDLSDIESMARLHKNKAIQKIDMLYISFPEPINLLENQRFFAIIRNTDLLPCVSYHKSTTTTR